MRNILSNNEVSDNYERRIQLEKLTPIGRAILETHRMERIDPRTIKLVKKENIPSEKSEIISKKGNKLD